MTEQAEPKVPEEYLTIVKALRAGLEKQSVDPDALERMKELKITARDSLHPNTICRFDWSCIALD